jgi:hypothetical protein
MSGILCRFNPKENYLFNVLYEEVRGGGVVENIVMQYKYRLCIESQEVLCANSLFNFLINARLPKRECEVMLLLFGLSDIRYWVCYGSNEDR